MNSAGTVVDPPEVRTALVRAAVTCLALVYPLYWLLESVRGSAPSLVRAAWPGGGFEGIAVSPLGLRIGASGAEGWLAGRPLDWLLVAAVTAGLWWLGKRFPRVRAAVGFVLVIWAVTLLKGLAWGYLRGGGWSLDLWRVAQGLLAVGISYGGFRWMLPALGDRSRVGRAAALALLILGPMTALGLLLWSTIGFPFDAFARRDLPGAVVAAIVGALVGSGMDPRTLAGSLHLPSHSWRGAAAGLIASILIFWGSQQAGQALEERSAAERAAALAAAPDNTALPRPSDEFFYKGVNFTAEPPAGYDSPAARENLERLPEYGVNAIALVPYAGSRLGSPTFRFPLPMERDEGIRFMAGVAHARGIRVLLKPQIWYRDGYPGDHDLASREDLETFFDNYREYVVHYAKLAEEMHADLFCVGVEFVKLSRHQDRWRELIRAAREHYSGPLTYAANFGEEFESVEFWDDLDFIGLDNYYPLPKDLSTSRIAERIETVQRRFNRPVLFTEVGFTTHEDTHERPWEDRRAGALSDAAQARCYEAVFKGFSDKPWLRGMFWWKFGSNDSGASRRRSGTHFPAAPTLDVVKSWYGRL